MGLGEDASKSRDVLWVETGCLVWRALEGDRRKLPSLPKNCIYEYLWVNNMNPWFSLLNLTVYIYTFSQLLIIEQELQYK